MFSDKAKLARKWLLTKRRMTQLENKAMFQAFNMDEMKAMRVVREIISENSS